MLEFYKASYFKSHKRKKEVTHKLKSLRNFDCLSVCDSNAYTLSRIQPIIFIFNC